MNEQNLKKPDYIFEVSWEVCNKVGGIYTVISTKALTLVKDYKDNLITIGPDIWKDTDHNPYFQEDRYLFRSWREYAESKGLRFKIGRWKIQGKPIAILIDFTPYISKKDEIFASLWETYRLDSLSGQWDYIEPALFGYAAGKLIENFYEYNHSSRDRIIAQFHEWMTGTGLLYLKQYVPQIGTVFTTHATVLGRCIAGNGLPLYNNIQQYDPDQKANEFNVKAKYSLEYTAANAADCFTTVSKITAKEIEHFLRKPVDIITPNGFEDSFVPCDKTFDAKRTASRDKLKSVSEAIFGCNVNENTMYIAVSGRYEFRNKGIDVFIDSLGKLNKSDELKREVVAFLLIPANNYGPRKELIDKLYKDEHADPATDIYLTHRIHDKEYDPILNRIKANNLHNRPEDKVKVIFVPSYLNGNDGVFNMDYYDVLIGFDLTVFASYYEPWGYTPLESLAFHIPTITTTLTGFATWVSENLGQYSEGIAIINRNDDNDAEVVKGIADKIIKCSAKSPEEIKQTRDEAFNISRSALWKNLIKYYQEAYNIALSKVELRSELFAAKRLPEQLETYENHKSSKQPVWRRVVVQPNIPEKLRSLRELANNLWWCWNQEAIDLFESIDEDLWKANKGNPIAFLDSLSYEQLLQLENNEDFLNRLGYVVDKFNKYIAKKNERSPKQIAYFSMEYGFHDSLKIFSGGLGILAGDYLKEASDCNVNLVGIGLLYRYGYFSQKLSASGEQLSLLEPQPFSKMPLNPIRDEYGNWKLVSLAFPGRTVYARIWRVDVGRICLYLLDTDFDANSPEDRSITHQLYGGDWENRLKQELLLGVGGIRALDILGLEPDIYHCNEGHAAFICIERLRSIIQKYNLTFSEATEIVKASTLFTTHTPVPAGHDAFSEDLLRTYIPHYASRLNLTWNEFMNLGRMKPNASDEKFSMSVLAARFSNGINGVSRIHGRVSQKMFNGMWEGYFPQELHISYVTNGVHYPTWAAKRWRMLYEKEFGEGFIHDQSNEAYWKKIYDVPDKTIWDIREKQRKDCLDYVIAKTIQTWTERGENPQRINKITSSINYKALTIGFARRFASYKRAYLLFKDLERLAKIVNMPDRPVQFIFAGKAHPNDKPGQELIKLINDIANRPEFFGKIIFVENYDIYLAKKLVQGVDVWLNNPMRPLEASGTSGEKAIMNGVLNLSVLDGWWAEGYIPGAGWALKEERTYENQDFQDALDAVTIYNLIENEIAPLFYDRNEEGIPLGWIKYIKNCIAGICPKFNMKRMLDDYINKYYNNMFARTDMMKQNNFKMAKEIAAWKKKVIRGWDSIEVVSLNLTDISSKMMKLGEKFEAEIVLDLKELSVEDIGVEVIFVESGDNNKIIFKGKLEVEEQHEKKVKYSTRIYASRSGIFNCGFRIFPTNPNLAHRQDFELVKWI